MKDEENKQLSNDKSKIFPSSNPLVPSPYVEYVSWMNNLLHSKHCQFVVLWFPKCACSSVRQFFIDWHKIYNPNFTKSHMDVTYHNIHQRIAFQYDSSFLVEQYIMVLRHPVRRFISMFFNKHVLQKDFSYFSSSNFQRFYVWMTRKGEEYTMKSLLQFMSLWGCFDVHDAPMTSMMPSWWSTIPKSKQTVIDIDKDSLGKLLRKALFSLSMFQGKRQHYLFSKYQPLFSNFPTINTTKTTNSYRMTEDSHVTPFTPSKKSSYLDWTISDWQEWYQEHQSFPLTSVQLHREIEYSSSFQKIYGTDLKMYSILVS